MENERHSHVPHHRAKSKDTHALSRRSDLPRPMMNYKRGGHDAESERLIASSSSSSKSSSSSSLVKRIGVGASVGALALFATSAASSSASSSSSLPSLLGEGAASTDTHNNNDTTNNNNNNIGGGGGGGQAAQQKKVFTLYTSCSGLLQQKNVLPFPLQENWKYIGAKLITKSMSEEFDFDAAKEMRMTTCGTFEVEHDSMKPNEQFGFYLYPKPRPSDGEEAEGGSLGSDEMGILHSSNGDGSFVGRLGRESKEESDAITKKSVVNTGKYRAVSELACENVSQHEEDQCPASRKGKVVAPGITLGDDEGNNKGTANASISKCTGQFTHGVSQRTGGVKNVFYNRVFDGETLSYVWGSCAHTCANADQPHRTLVPAGCDVPQLFAVKAKMSVAGNSMTAQKLLTNEKQNDALKSAIAGIVNVQPKDVVIKSLKDVALTEEALLGEMKQSQDEGFVDISEFAKRVARLEDQHSEVYKENQQLTKLNIELAENKKALEDKINNWKAENEKLRQAIAERQTTLDITNAGSRLGEEVLPHGKPASADVPAKSTTGTSSLSAVEVEFEVIVRENENDAKTILKSLMSTAPEKMLKVLNNSRGINMLKQVTYLSAPKVQKVLETESTLSFETVPQTPKTEEQLVKENKQIENANDAVKVATSASKVAEIEAKRKVSEEVDTARELVEQEKMAASNAFREALIAQESVIAERDDDIKEALEEEAAKLEARAVRAQEEADVAQDVLNEETKKLHRSGNVVISSSSSSSSSSASEPKFGRRTVDNDGNKEEEKKDDDDKEFKEILEEVEEVGEEERREALEEKESAKAKNPLCEGKVPTHKVQASVAISGAGITSARQISTHSEFADSFSKTIVTLTGADEGQLIWLDLSTRPREEEGVTKSSKLGSWFSSGALGRFVSDESNEEPVEVTFSLLSCSRKDAKDFVGKLYGLTPKSMLASAKEYGAAIDDIQFVSPPKVLPVDENFLESYEGPTIEGKSTSVNVKPRVKTMLKIVSSEAEAEMEEKGEEIEKEEKEEEKDAKRSTRSTEESGNGSVWEELTKNQRHQKESIGDDEEAY